MKKYVKYTLIGTSLLATTGIIIGFSTSWKSMPIISVGGSSAVSPLITEYSNTYSESDIVVQAGGSGAGITNALEGRKNIGMASKNPKGLTNTDIKDKWIKNKMKTITIAWDGIGIVYKPVDKNATLDINDNTIIDIYKAFAGFEVSCKTLGLSKTDERLVQSFARDGGAEKSGTADAFLNDSHLSVALDNEVKSILKNGTYKKNTRTTAESNVESWEYFKSANVTGSMVYLSTGFILNNWKEIIDGGFKVASYNNNALTQDKIAKDYKWYRPFNLMTSLSTITEPIKKFIEYVAFPSSEVKEIINRMGFVPLTPEQINSMKKDKNPSGEFWVPDSELKYCGAEGGN